MSITVGYSDSKEYPYQIVMVNTYGAICSENLTEQGVRNIATALMVFVSNQQEDDKDDGVEI